MTETRTFEVGARICHLRAEIVGGSIGKVVIEWAPDRPGRLSSTEWAQLRQGRNRAMAELIQVYGEPLASESTR